MSFENAMKKLNLETIDYDVSSVPTASLANLTELKQLIESNLAILFNQLQNKYHADFHTPLLSPDGFPRADIDVVQIRLIRTQIIRLKNDLRIVLDAIDGKLIDHFANISKHQPQDNPTTTVNIPAQTTTIVNIPFAVVDQVVSGSPADQAGLLVGDRIATFGNINATNHDNLKRIVSVVQNNVGNEISLGIIRNGNNINFNLTPNSNWGGVGLLGCKLNQI